MPKVIFIDDNGRQHDITQAVSEQMGELNHRSGQQSHHKVNHHQMMRQEQPHMGRMPQHMPGMENAMPMPQGMRPEDFAGDDNVRVIPVPVPMNGAMPMGQGHMPQHMQGMHMPQRMHGGMPMSQQMQGGMQVPQNGVAYSMRMGQPVSMRHGMAQPQMGRMFRQPIPSNHAMGGSPFYQSFDDEY